MGTVKEKGEKTKDQGKIKIKGQKLSKKGAWAVNFGLCMCQGTGTYIVET